MRRAGIASLACLLLAGAGLTACSSSDGPAEAVETFLQGWRGSDLSQTGFITAAGDRIAADAVLTKLQDLTGDLSKATLVLSADGEPTENGENASAPIKVDWTLPGGAAWTYRSTVRLTKRDTDGWRVVWEPAILHAKLTEGDILGLRRTPADRADILDSTGKPIVTKRDVVTIGISPERVDDQAKLLKSLTTALAAVDVTYDEAELKNRLRTAKPTAFVTVITLRAADFEKIRQDVYDLPGAVFQKDTLELAPTRTFARALLGTVGDATKDDLSANPDTLVEGDEVGHGGLQQRYDAQLRGVAGQKVVVGTRTPDDRIEDGEVLWTQQPTAGTPVKTTLDVATQNAADAAVAAEKQPSALVAVRISDSSILAVSNGPDGDGVNTAMTGQVPPGSTFKMVSALGLLDKKAVTADATVPCPKTAEVSGRSFKNSHDMELGNVPFHTDFAKSCNTAFVALAPKLGADGLAAAATSVGLGQKWDVGADAFSGTISPAGTPTELAAATFGQGATAVSPLAMASATAAVARGQFVQPRVMLDPAPPNPVADGPRLAQTSVEPLRTMMREVVTSGTATALSDVPGPPVSGKTGTAEFAEDTDDTHSWFIGWQGDIAFAIMVQNGGAGADAAVPVAERFLTALN